MIKFIEEYYWIVILILIGLFIWGMSAWGNNIEEQSIIRKQKKLVNFDKCLNYTSTAKGDIVWCAETFLVNDLR